MIKCALKSGLIKLVRIRASLVLIINVATVINTLQTKFYNPSLMSPTRELSSLISLLSDSLLNSASPLPLKKHYASLAAPSLMVVFEYSHYGTCCVHKGVLL